MQTLTCIGSHSVPLIVEIFLCSEDHNEHYGETQRSAHFVLTSTDSLTYIFPRTTRPKSSSVCSFEAR